ncbi:hypothetical protein [Acidaminococcus sp. CAG:542]|uniref:hypothetical protein n=1 Tax=Acidaminococcus sp. CAG:542 TaxID=1262687 RepID=UPI002589F647|nr:hypothetical protein [Acidaminococcus sp. CAG:542]
MEKTWFLPGLFLMEKTGGRDGLAFGLPLQRQGRGFGGFHGAEVHRRLDLLPQLKTLKEYRNAVKETVKKPIFVPHVGTHQCRIANYGPSSSPMGQLAAALNW